MARIHAASGGPPRLVLRFAVATALALALAAGAILLVVRHFDTVQAERSATSHARLIASSVLRESLQLSDFSRVTPERQAELDTLFARHVLNQGILRATLYASDGTVTYSTDHRLIGSRAAQPEHLREALAGTVRGDVTSLAQRNAPEPLKALRTYAPVAVPSGTGVVALFQDYRPIARAADETFLPVAGIFEAVLIALFIVLLPILRRVTLRVRRQMDEIEYRALYDELTELPNRNLFRERIEEMIAAQSSSEGGSGAIMLLDVDRFKEINEALGHDLGDLLLQELGKRLRVLVETTETLARLSGDEFGILLPDASVEQAVAVADRLHAALEAPFALRGLPLEIAVSAGIAVYPDHGGDVETLLQHADVAMYFAKDSHLRTAVYDAEQDKSDAARLALAGELRRAIDIGELVVFFQPKADLRTGRVVGAEALVRWQHPDRGFIPPNEFVPIAERTGLIKPLSRYVLAAALRQCAAWNASGFDLRVSVNVTVPDLLDIDFPERIVALLEETDVKPEQLELEITETTILADPYHVRAVLTRLNELGLRFAIDDFGTGYSSLAYLRRLPVHTIKIDRSFVMTMCEDMNDATIVRSTIDLGRNLGLEVVAEGVETQEVWSELRALGCSVAQGYLLGRPVPAEELESLLEERGHRAGAEFEAGLVRL